MFPGALKSLWMNKPARKKLYTSILKSVMSMIWLIITLSDNPDYSQPKHLCKSAKLLQTRQFCQNNTILYIMRFLWLEYCSLCFSGSWQLCMNKPGVRDIDDVKSVSTYQGKGDY